MNVLYVSNLCSNAEYARLYNNYSVKPSMQAQKFNSMLAQGLVANGNSVTVMSGRPLNQTILPSKWYRHNIEITDKMKYVYLASYNKRYLRQLTLIINARKYVKKWLKYYPDGVIICDVLNFSLLRAIMPIIARTNNKCAGIFTDLPEMLGASKRNETIYKLADKCTHYVILAEAMNVKVNRTDKPYIVVEGFSDVRLREISNNLNDKNGVIKVVYTGLIHRKYGIANLVEGFIAAQLPNVELHVYGMGDYEDELRKIAAKQRNIKFHGMVSNDDAVKAQIEATLLVNPRPTNEEFVKYSFPSKNMEYIASGTPLLTTVLPAMGKEYYDYVFLLHDETPQGMATALRYILLNYKEQQLNEFGLKAKTFAMQSKNNVARAKEIEQFLLNDSIKQL